MGESQDTIRCIYCKQVIRTASREEVVPFALGGSHWSRKLVCRACNSRLGYEVDSHLCNWRPFVWARSLLRIEGHDGHIPWFEHFDYEGNQYTVEPGWSLQLKPVRPDYSFSPGPVHLSIQAASVDAAMKQAECIRKSYLRQLRKGGLRNARARLEITGVEKRVHRVPQFALEEVSWGPLQWRGVAKIALNLLATRLSRDHVCSADFDPIREFVVSGHRVGCFTLPGVPDFHGFGERYLPAAPTGEFVHQVAVFCSRSERNAIGLVELFGALRFVVVLSWQYEGPDRAFCLTEYPRHRSHTESLLQSHLCVPTARLMTLDRREWDRSKTVCLSGGYEGVRSSTGCSECSGACEWNRAAVACRYATWM